MTKKKKNKEKDNNEIETLEKKINNQKKDYELKLNNEIKQIKNDFIKKMKESEIKFNDNLEDLLKKYNDILEKEKLIEKVMINFLKNINIYCDDIKNPINNIFEFDFCSSIIKRINNKLDCSDDEKKENKINEIDEFFKKYEKPTLIGLNEIKNESIMNSTLQCLSQTIGLTKYFLKNQDNIKFNNKSDLSLAYLEIINKLWEINGPKSFSPINFKNAIDKIKPITPKKDIEYYTKYLFTLIEQLHNELRKKINFKSIIFNNELNGDLNSCDKKNAFFHFFKEFLENCSIISDIYFGMLETGDVCLKCKNVYKYNYCKFDHILFPLEEISDNKISNSYLSNNQIMENSIITLKDCFKYYENNKKYGLKNNICNICNEQTDFEYTTKIYSCPNNLILVLISVLFKCKDFIKKYSF